MVEAESLRKTLICTPLEELDITQIDEYLQELNEIVSQASSYEAGHHEKLAEITTTTKLLIIEFVRPLVSQTIFEKLQNLIDNISIDWGTTSNQHASFNKVGSDVVVSIPQAMRKIAENRLSLDLLPILLIGNVIHEIAHKLDRFFDDVTSQSIPRVFPFINEYGEKCFGDLPSERFAEGFAQAVLQGMPKAIEIRRQIFIKDEAATRDGGEGKKQRLLSLLKSHPNLKSLIYSRLALFIERGGNYFQMSNYTNPSTPDEIRKAIAASADSL